MKIYSKIHPDVVIHIVVKADEVINDRENVISDEEPLQLATMRLPKGKTFKPHAHVFKNVSRYTITQESWIVIKGSVKAILYDTDGRIIAEPILNAGDCSITLYGGHNYEILEDDTIVYEFKTGPYEGVEKDKVFI